MLVLSRKLNEGIRIGPNVVLKVIEIKGGRVKLGFEAPRHVKIARDELDQKKDRGDNEHTH
mgnify:CR=1 FL=1